MCGVGLCRFGENCYLKAGLCATHGVLVNNLVPAGTAFVTPDLETPVYISMTAEHVVVACPDRVTTQECLELTIMFINAKANYNQQHSYSKTYNLLRLQKI